MRQLQALQLENRQAVVARVAQLLTEQGGRQAVLEVRGQSLTVTLPENAPELKVGDLLRIMREGQTLTLMNKLPLPAEAGLTQALARHLPWQQNIDSGLNQLLSALVGGLRSAPGSPQPGRTEALPPAVREALQAIASSLPRPATTTTPGNQPLATSLSPPGSSGGTSPPTSLTKLDAAQVQQWLANSGTLAEARLARGVEPAPTDLKLALGRVALALLQHQNLGQDQFTRFTPLPSQELVSSPLQFPAPTSAPLSASADAGQPREAPSAGQMLRLLAGMLNRITVNQLHSQLLSIRGAEAPAPTNTLVTDLPWIAPGGDAKTAQLKIEYERPDHDERRTAKRAGVAEWRFSLAMDLDQAGQVFFEVALRQNAVSARVWADRQDTVRQVNRELGELRSRLIELGLDVSELECRRGQPPAATTRLEHRIVDTRA